MLFRFFPLLALVCTTYSLPIANVAERETPLNAFLALLLKYLPAVNGTINAVASVLTTFEALLVDVTGLSDSKISPSQFHFCVCANHRP